RIVQMDDEYSFDPRSYPESNDPNSPIMKVSKILTPVIPPDENLLYVQHAVVDKNGRLNVLTYGAAEADFKFSDANFIQATNGSYVLAGPGSKAIRNLRVERPKGRYFVLFQYSWGIGVLPPDPGGKSY